APTGIALNIAETARSGASHAVRNTDVMDDTRQLSRAPTLIDAQSRDEVGPRLAEIGVVAGEADVGAAAAEAVRAGALRGDGRREAAAEGRGVGQQIGLVEALLVRREQVRPAFAAAEEGEERVRLTSGDSGPLHVGAVDVGAGAGVVEA